MLLSAKTLCTDLLNLEQAWDAVLRDSDGKPQEDGQTAEQKYEPTDQQSMYTFSASDFYWH